MAEDLGTWPPEQATVLLEVLQKAGLSPQAKRTKAGVVVTVPDDQSEQAHLELVANMDTIANAARRPKPAGGPQPRRPRPVKGADNTAERSPEQAAALRLRRSLAILAVVVVALLAILSRNPIFVLAAVGLIIYLLGRRAQQQGGGDDRPGPSQRW